MRGSLLGASPWYKLFIAFLVALVGTFLMLSIGAALVPVFFNVSMMDAIAMLQNPNSPGAIEILKFLQGFNTLGTFLMPALIMAYLISPFPSDYLQINTFPRKGWLVLILIVCITLGSTVISDALIRLTYEIPFPAFMSGFKEYLDELQGMTEQHIASLLEISGLWEFLEIFMIMAILPAVCEETLFRGIVQPLFIKGFRNVHIGIIVTSIIFGLLHQQFYSFLSITALSVVLGYLKHWSKSLWVPIVMHLLNNGTIIIAVYFFNVPLDDLADGSTTWDVYYFIPGVIAFTMGLFFLHKLLNNKTDTGFTDFNSKQDQPPGLPK